MARGGAANLVGAAVNGAAGFLLVLAVTRLLGKPEAGTLFVTISIFLILLAAVELGATTGLVRWIPQYLAAGRERDLRALLRTSLLPVLAVSGLVAALLWPLAPWVIDVLAPHGSGGTGSTDGPQVLRLLSLFLPVAAVYDVLLAATRGFDRIRPTVMVERIGRVPGQLLLVAAAGLVSHQLVAVSVAWALPYLPGLLVAGWLTVRLLLRAERMTDAARAVAPPTGRRPRRRPGRRRSCRSRRMPAPVPLLVGSAGSSGGTPGPAGCPGSSRWRCSGSTSC